MPEIKIVRFAIIAVPNEFSNNEQLRLDLHSLPSVLQISSVIQLGQNNFKNCVA